jgi:hypothetical protein
VEEHQLRLLGGGQAVSRQAKADRQQRRARLRRRRQRRKLNRRLQAAMAVEVAIHATPPEYRKRVSIPPPSGRFRKARSDRLVREALSRQRQGQR